MKIINKNKKGLQFQSTIIALVIFSMAIVAIGVWVNQWDQDYDSGINSDLSGYSKLDDLSDYASTSKGTLAPKTSSDTTGTGDFEGTSLRGAFSIVNNIFNPFNLLLGKSGIINSLEDRWGVPNYISIGIITIIVLAIVFSLIALFFRKLTPA